MADSLLFFLTLMENFQVQWGLKRGLLPLLVVWNYCFIPLFTISTNWLLRRSFRKLPCRMSNVMNNILLIVASGWAVMFFDCYFVVTNNVKITERLTVCAMCLRWWRCSLCQWCFRYCRAVLERTKWSGCSYINIVQERVAELSVQMAPTNDGFRSLTGLHVRVLQISWR